MASRAGLRMTPGTCHCQTIVVGNVSADQKAALRLTSNAVFSNAIGQACFNEAIAIRPDNPWED